MDPVDVENTKKQTLGMFYTYRYVSKSMDVEADMYILHLLIFDINLKGNKDRNKNEPKSVD